MHAVMLVALLLLGPAAGKKLKSPVTRDHMKAREQAAWVLPLARAFV